VGLDGIWRKVTKNLGRIELFYVDIFGCVFFECSFLKKFLNCGMFSLVVWLFVLVIFYVY